MKYYYGLKSRAIGKGRLKDVINLLKLSSRYSVGSSINIYWIKELIYNVSAKCWYSKNTVTIVFETEMMALEKHGWERKI